MRQPPKVTRVFRERMPPSNGKPPRIEGARLDWQTRIVRIAATIGLVLSAWLQVIIVAGAALVAIAKRRKS